MVKVPIRTPRSDTVGATRTPSDGHVRAAPSRGYLSLQDAAQRVGVSVKTLTRAIRRRELCAYRVGGRLVRIAEADLRAYIERVPA